MPRPEFVHLHLHTEFSFLDGISPIGELFDWVKEIEQPGVAITDHGECSGHIQADKFGYDRDIKPIFGMEGYFADSRHDKKGRKRSEHDHITLLALNNRGLENLWTLSTLAWTEGTWYGDPRMDWELLEKYNEGLIVTSGCLSGVVTKYIREDHELSNPDKGIERISRMLDIFGDRFYIELHTFDDDIQKEVNTRLVEIASEFGLPTVAVSDSHYLRPEDWQKHELVTAVSMNKDLYDESRYQYGEAQLDVKPVEDVVSRLSYLPEEIVKESVENTVEIYKQVDVSLPYDRATPVFFDNAKTDSMKVIDQAQEGLERKVFPTVQKKSKRKEYVQRLEFELKVITQKDLAGYFLMMADIVKWAKDQGIATGPSRGSGGGSLLAYVLDITEVDPVATGLLFERFLNPGRDALPDIDIDFEEEGRDRVIEYLREKYGEYAVATIGTINRWKPKQMMRDLARGLKIPINESNKMSEVIENIWNFDVGVDVTWKEVAERPEHQEALAYWRNKYPYLFELMNDLFLNCRHTGAHAGGVVVNKESLLGKIPMRYRNNDMRTQFEMDEVEALGYPKMDFLGLRNLSTLKRAWEIIHERNDVDLPFFYDWQYEWDKYYGDQDVIRGLWGGNNIGVFQLETSNLMGLIKDFKPNSLEEIAELISVFRPGITRTVDEDTGENMLSLYLKRRHGLLPPKKYHPIADKILEETYSHFVYQEQVMQIFGELADYTETERDDIRKIIGKKKTYEFPKHREALRQRAWEYHQVPYETSDKIFDDLEKTGHYSFNKAHAMGYAIISFWGAYLKHYWPTEYLTALFQTDSAKTEVYTREAHRLGIEVLPPDINESDMGFTLTKDGRIRYGLKRIKYVANGAKLLTELRPFDDVFDFAERVPKSKFKKTAVESLVRVGALDSIVSEVDQYPQDWSFKKIALHQYWSMRNELSNNKEWRDIDMECEECRSRHTNFDHYVNELKLDDLVYNEQEFLGTVVSFDPLEEYMPIISKEMRYPGEDFMIPGETARIGGLIESRRDLKTKRGRNPGAPMCQFWLQLPLYVGSDEEDTEPSIQIVAFPDVFGRYQDDIEKGTPVLCDVEKLENGGVRLVRLFNLLYLE